MEDYPLRSDPLSEDCFIQPDRRTTEDGLEIKPGKRARTCRMATSISKCEDSPSELVEAAKEDQTGGLLVVGREENDCHGEVGLKRGRVRR